MRLWHEKLLPHLPKQQLLGQHRECAALRGNGWNKSHSTVNYVFNYHPVYLYCYHLKVMNEMQNRGYKPDVKWYNYKYRGKSCEPYEYMSKSLRKLIKNLQQYEIIFPEHDQDYLRECLQNLQSKGIDLSYVA